MHELSYAKQVVEALVEEARSQRLRRVTHAKIGIGVLLQLEEEEFREALRIASEGTIAEGCEFELEVIKALARCPSGHEFELEAEDPLELAEKLRCPSCEAVGKVVDGNSCVLLQLRGQP